MNKKRFIKAVGILQADLNAIREKVETVEKRTSGEIALAIIKQSDSYAAIELTVASFVAFIFGVIFTIFAGRIQAFLSKFYWLPSISLFASLFLIFTSTVFLLTYLFLNISSSERIFIPKSVRLAKTKRRAYLHFFESGLYKTKERSGILIFVSVLERTVIVFADEGINAKVEQSEWNEICQSLILSLKQKKAGKGFLAAAEQCGEILAKAFPAKAVNPNELADGLVVLEH